MQKIKIETKVQKFYGDVHTPVGIYLRLRDRFRDTILLESADSHAAANSHSFICINAIAGIELKDSHTFEIKLPAHKPERKKIEPGIKIPALTANYLQAFEVIKPAIKEGSAAQSLFGYTAYDSIPLFENISFQSNKAGSCKIPGFRYRLYQYVIVMNHFKNEMYLCENILPGIVSDVATVETLIKSRDLPVYPFATKDSEKSNMTDDDYLQMVREGIRHCMRGDVFQIVLSRRFEQSFTGDEFNVYRALRSINPSPYLFYFDYGDYKIFGSSPESQLIIRDGIATLHPIAGTFRRTGNDDEDAALALALQNDPKEKAEHTMLVDLARNDLSRLCAGVYVADFQKVHYYSHVIHLVSEVKAAVPPGVNALMMLGKTFPAGTLSGAPKYKAMQLIDSLEPADRSYYGGCAGTIGLDGSFNQAIMIRTFLSKNNTLYYQAGAGVVAASEPQNELQEVNNKLGALKKAIEDAAHII